MKRVLSIFGIGKTLTVEIHCDSLREMAYIRRKISDVLNDVKEIPPKYICLNKDVFEEININ